MEDTRQCPGLPRIIIAPLLVGCDELLNEVFPSAGPYPHGSYRIPSKSNDSHKLDFAPPAFSFNFTAEERPQSLLLMQYEGSVT